MNTDFADGVQALEDGVDQAVVRAMNYGLTEKEVAEELRRIADQWEAEGD